MNDTAHLHRSLRKFRGLAAILAAVAGLAPHEVGGQTFSSPVVPVAFDVPRGWATIPDSIVAGLSDFFSEMSDEYGTTLIALLCPADDPWWNNEPSEWRLRHPYVMVRYDTVGTRSLATLEAELAESGVVLEQAMSDAEAALAPYGVIELEFGQVVLDAPTGVLWLRLNSEDPSNGPTVATGGSVFFDGAGRLGVTYYGPASEDPSYGTGVVEFVLASASFEGRNPMTDGSHLSTPVLTESVALPWIVAAGIGLFVGVGAVLVKLFAGRVMASKVVGWAMALTGLALWAPAKFLGAGPLVALGQLPRFLVMVVLLWGGLILIGRGNEPSSEATGDDASCS